MRRQNVLPPFFIYKQIATDIYDPNINPHLQTPFAYFISQKVNKISVVCVTQEAIHVKDWKRIPFTAHSLLLPSVLVSYLDEQTLTT